MPELIDVSVRSNVDALSGARLHQALIDMVERVVRDSAEFMRAIEPKRTGALEAATSHTDPVEDVVNIIEAKIGVTEIGQDVPRSEAQSTIPGAQDSSHYPLFVDRGTGVFGPTASPIFARSARSMVFTIGERKIFAGSVRGQRGQHFFAATAAFAEALLRTDQHIRVALDEMAAQAAATSLREH